MEKKRFSGKSSYPSRRDGDNSRSGSSKVRFSSDDASRSDRPQGDKRQPSDRKNTYSKEGNDKPAWEKKEYRSGDQRGGNRPAFRSDDKSSGDKRPFRRNEEGSRSGERQPWKSDRPAFGSGRPAADGKPRFDKGPRRDERGERSERSERGERSERPAYNKPFRKAEGDEKPRFPRPERQDDRSDRPRRSFDKDSRGGSSGKPSFGRSQSTHGSSKPRRSFGEKGENFKYERIGDGAKPPRKSVQKPHVAPRANQDGFIRLNKFIANSGVCSRREADMLITAGAVTVNGNIVSELGTKISPSDTVIYNGQRLVAERKVYVLLNKPKDFITTSDDPEGRRTVMELVKNACDERLFPVGRLDRNTTGLLLLTNDGDMTKRLTHPKHGVRKLYHVVLDKPLTRADMAAISQGVQIDEEKVLPDEISYVGNGEDKTQIGIELHSGQNRVVRRIFESFDYKVEKLDRVIFAGLTKRDLPRGHWRFLSEQEVNFLKMH